MKMLTDREIADLVCNTAALVNESDIKAAADALVLRAAALGLVLTVEQVPLLPLAMGNHRTTVSVRCARVPA